jgi:hypothetical protein
MGHADHSARPNASATSARRVARLDSVKAGFLDMTTSFTAAGSAVWQGVDHAIALLPLATASI